MAVVLLVTGGLYLVRSHRSKPLTNKDTVFSPILLTAPETQFFDDTLKTGAPVLPCDQSRVA